MAMFPLLKVLRIMRPCDGAPLVRGLWLEKVSSCTYTIMKKVEAVMEIKMIQNEMATMMVRAVETAKSTQPL